MTVNEFNIQFDVLYNNITSNQAPGLNEYEKSVFLTKAQSEIVKNYFLASHNVKQEGYMDSPKREHDFSSIIVTKTLNEPATSGDKYYYNNSKCVLFDIPSNVFMVLNEQLIEENKVYTIVSIEYSEFSKLMKKPYKLPLKGQAWKMNHYDVRREKIEGYHENVYYNQAEFIGNFTDVTKVIYQIRYIKTLQPIILADIGQYNVTIRGKEYPYDAAGESIEEEDYNTKSPCMLPEELHEEILQRAVEIAKGVWQGDIQSTIELGNRSE